MYIGERTMKGDRAGVAHQDTNKILHYIDEYAMIGISTAAAFTRLISNMSLSGRIVSSTTAAGIAAQSGDADPSHTCLC